MNTINNPVEAIEFLNQQISRIDSCGFMIPNDIQYLHKDWMSNNQSQKNGYIAGLACGSLVLGLQFNEWDLYYNLKREIPGFNYKATEEEFEYLDQEYLDDNPDQELGFLAGTKLLLLAMVQELEKVA